MARWERVSHIYDPLKAGSIDGTDTIPHDRGIVRAMQATYKPNKLVVGNPCATIFIGNLNRNTDEKTLKKKFSVFGDIKRTRLVRDIVTGFSKRYAFIEYFDPCDAVTAEREMNHDFLEGHELFVDIECERMLEGWIPRRLGGGLSGRKESGQLRFGGKQRPFKRPLVVPKTKDNAVNRPYAYKKSSAHEDYRHKESYSDRYKSRHSDR